MHIKYIQISLNIISQLFSVARRIGHLKRNPPNFTFDLVSDRSANKRTTFVLGNIRYYVAVVCVCVCVCKWLCVCVCVCV